MYWCSFLDKTFIFTEIFDMTKFHMVWRYVRARQVQEVMPRTSLEESSNTLTIKVMWVKWCIPFCTHPWSSVWPRQRQRPPSFFSGETDPTLKTRLRNYFRFRRCAGQGSDYHSCKFQESAWQQSGCIFWSILEAVIIKCTKVCECEGTFIHESHTLNVKYSLL